ncbi:hypothetical protein D3C80_2027300 [compost metagenome]
MQQFELIEPFDHIKDVFLQELPDDPLPVEPLPDDPLPNDLIPLSSASFMSVTLALAFPHQTKRAEQALPASASPFAEQYSCRTIDILPLIH